MEGDIFDIVNRDILMKVRDDSSRHEEYCEMLLNIYRQHPFVDFYTSLQQIICVVLQQRYKPENIRVNRTIDFLAEFCVCETTIRYSVTVETNNTVVYQNIFNFLFEQLTVENYVVRYRSCELINKMLTTIGPFKLDDEFFDHLREVMLQRLTDVKSGVRLQAIFSIHRYQNYSDRDCIITRKLMERISDIKPKIRIAVIERLKVHGFSMNNFIKCLNDPVAEVRLATYVRLAKLCKALTIVQRQLVIKGVYDVNERVKSYVRNELIKSWLAAYDNRCVEFICNALLINERDENNASYIALVCLIRGSTSWQQIISGLTLDQNCLIPLDRITWQKVLYLRLLARFCQSATTNTISAYIDSILPDLSVFVNHVKRFCDVCKDVNQVELILPELFRIAVAYNLSSHTNRVVVSELVKYVLVSLDLGKMLLEIVIKTLNTTINSVELREDFFFGIVSDINILIPNHRIRSNRVNILELRAKTRQLQQDCEELRRETANSNVDNYENELEIIRVRLDELETVTNNNSRTLCRRLRICRAYVLFTNVNVLTPRLEMLGDDLLEILINPYPKEVLIEALDCFTVCCVLDHETARRAVFVLFDIMLKMYDEGEDFDVVNVAMKTICSIFLVYDAANPSENMEFSFNDVLLVFVDFLKHEPLKLSAGVNLCRLIKDGKTSSPYVLSSLMLTWCDPSSQNADSLELRRYMRTMLANVAQMRSQLRDFENAFFFTLEILINVPYISSELSEDTIFDAVRFMLNTFCKCDDNFIVHTLIALRVCTEIRNNPEKEFIAIYAKILLMQELLPYNRASYDMLLEICREIYYVVINNPTVVNSVLQFQTRLMHMIALEA